MLKQNPKTLIQSNQVQVYMTNHAHFVESGKLNLVLEGYNKLESYIKRLIEMCENKRDAMEPEQVEMQVHLVKSMLEGLIAKNEPMTPKLKLDAKKVKIRVSQGIHNMLRASRIVDDNAYNGHLETGNFNNIS